MIAKTSPETTCRQSEFSVSWPYQPFTIHGRIDFENKRRAVKMVHTWISICFFMLASLARRAARVSSTLRFRSGVISCQRV